MRAPASLTEFGVVEDILAAHRNIIGEDFAGYRNHCQRVAHLCRAFVGDAIDADKIGIAAAFHDLGIWTAGTFDYLAPSVALARDYLDRTGRTAWADEIAEAILQHHKVSATHGAFGLVEPFRRADWVDVSFGLRRFGLSHGFVRELYARWPGAGFHRTLLRLEIRHFRHHPLNPLPMFRL